MDKHINMNKETERARSANKIINIIAKIELAYSDCYDEKFGTFDYEKFGEEVVKILYTAGLKGFNKKTK